MKLNTVRSYPACYHPPTLPEGLVSHTHLADLLVHYVEYVAPAMRPPVNEEGIRRILELAFYTSLAPEEGIFPKFNLSCQDIVGTPFTMSRFEPINLDSVNAVRKLAPSCTHPDCALLVSYENNMVRCEGIANIGYMGTDVMPGRPEFTSGGGRSNMKISVLGPGHLLANMSMISYELREGTIRFVSDYWSIPGIRTFREQLAGYLVEEISNRGINDFEKLFGGPTNSLPILNVLSVMLNVAVNARRGGAFVVLPTNESDTEKYGIDLKHKITDFDLGNHIVDFWCSCANVAQMKDLGNYASKIRKWTLVKSNLLLAAEAAGNLSCIDGCVVLNQRFQLCGFGGEIRIPDDFAKKETKLNFSDFKTGDLWDYDKFIESVGGTRHKSAARLCKAHGGVICFVISQDGQMKAFISQGENVHAFGPLDATRPPVGYG